MSADTETSKSILIIGGGTFGTSTAYHLSLRGYTSVTVLDRFPIPSVEAAGNDINKVIRSDYAEPLYTTLGNEAFKHWRDPNSIFNPHFHETGWLIGAAEASLAFVEASLENTKRLGNKDAKFISPELVRERWHAITGSMQGDRWKIVHNTAAGWADAKSALVQMAEVAKANGVKYITGKSGFVTRFVYENNGICTGVECKDGSKYAADLLVLAAGAAAAGLLDMKGQLVAKGHTVGHIQLSAEEVEKYKGIPIFDHLEQGIVFPPNSSGIMKFAACEFFKNVSHSPIPGVSLPRYRTDYPEDALPSPLPNELKIRGMLREFLPELAEREWIETRFCWDADTSDLHFLIGSHPEHKNLKLAVGGSAHGFKFLPIIGKYIADMLEQKLDPEIARCWKWRPGAKASSEGLSAHPVESHDLSEYAGWDGNNREGVAEKARL